MRDALLQAKNRFRELLFLRGAQRRAENYSESQGKAVRDWYSGCRERLLAARELRDSSRLVGAAAVYREAAECAACCLAVHFEVESKFLRSAVWERTREFADRASELTELRAFALASDLLESDRQSNESLQEELKRVDQSIQAVLRRVEGRRVSKLKWLRWTRVGLAILVPVALLTLLMVWLVSPTNLAFQAKAAASSYWPGSGKADRLINGSREMPWGAATGEDKQPWFQLDFGRQLAFGRIDVVNRKDGYAQVTTPFVIELSEDGKKFVEIARFTGPGEKGEEFSWRGQAERARFIRVRHLKHRAFALCEIEVYAP